jgi:16S rRNA (cytidine1402-2'-O)-methyltransferase
MAVLGDRRIAVCREMTKLHEEVFRGSLTEAIAHFEEPRGEFVLVIEGAEIGHSSAPDERPLEQALAELAGAGRPARDAVSELVRRFNLPRRTAYRLWLRQSEKERS